MGSLRDSLSLHLTEFLHTLGPWAPLAFIALTVTLCVLCIPGIFLTIAAGTLFGWGWGTLYAWLGAQIGASAAFAISRRFAHQRFARRLAHHPLLAAIENAVTLEGWRIVGLLRLAPGSPFFLLNYLFGLTRVRYLEYALATAISSLPGTLFFVYLGALGQKALAENPPTAWRWALHALGAIALFLACLVLARRARSALAVHLTHSRTDAPTDRPSHDPSPQ